MGAEDIVGLSGNLPYYIVITLFFSYLIWSKFLKEDKLKIEDINDILNIIRIFTFLFVSLIGTSLLLFFKNILNNMPININSVWGQTIIVLTFYVILGIGLITRYKPEKVSIIDLKNTFIWIIRAYLLLSLYFMSLLVVIILSHFSYLVPNIGFLLTLTVFIIMICYVMIDKEPFEVKFGTILSRNFIIFTILMIPVFFVFFYLSIPQIDYGEAKHSNYHIYIPGYNPPSDHWDIYSETSIPIRIKPIGILGTLIPQIPIPYGRYDINTEGVSRNAFGVWVNTSDSIVPQSFIQGFESLDEYEPKENNNYGFTHITLDEKKKLFTLVFDKAVIKKQTVNAIILNGYIKKNMSELDFSYSDNRRSPDLCYGDSCTLMINATNGLDLPVYLKDDFFIFNFNNRNIADKSKCKFVKVTSNYPEKDRYPRAGDIYMDLINCNGNHCSFEIRGVDKENMHYDIFDIDLGIKDNGVGVELRKLWFKKPLSINAKLDIVC